MKWYIAVLAAICGLTVLYVLSSVFYKQFFKRFYDIVLSGLAIIFLSPVIILLTVLGVVKMKGNPFFVQQRPGIIDKKTGKEKIFRLIKFRTMSNLRDKNGNLLPDKDRLTSYGKMLRSTSLDELPELFNIFAGDMSIIGPRPQLVRDMVFMSEEQRKRHSVRPGLSGLAQISGRNAISWESKLATDLKYIENISLLGDVKLILLTIKKVLVKEGISSDNSETSEDYGDILLKEGKVGEDEYTKKQEEALQLLGG